MCKKKRNNLIVYFVKFSIFAASIVFIYKKFRNFSFENFNIDDSNFFLLLIAVFLLFFNWSIEAEKWKILVSTIKTVKFSKAIQNVLMSLSFGLITPNRLGEIPARAAFWDKNNIKKGTLLASLGSFMQAFATFFFGIIGLGLFLFIKNGKTNFINEWGMLYLFLLAVFFIIVLLFFADILNFLLKFKIIRNFFKLKNNLKVDRKVIKKGVLLSFIRYLVFTTQFFLLLLVFDVKINILSAYASIFVTYLIMNFIPSFTLSDPPIRSSVSIGIMGLFSSNIAGIMYASLMIWFINIIMPTVVGLFLFMKFSIKSNV